MADVFEDRADLVAVRGVLFDVIETTTMLDWQLLTKRPMNIARMVPRDWLTAPRPNVWYGTTVESPDYLWRVAELVAVPAQCRFVSYEPALADVTWPLADMHWLIAGGESGGRFRAVDPAWMRSARDQCVSAGVPFFFKQWGGLHPKSNGAELDGREWKQFPT
jgi:protein gp37